MGVNRFASLSEDELVYIDRSLREGRTMQGIAKALGYSDTASLRGALSAKGYKRGNCLISIGTSAGMNQKERRSISREESEYYRVMESFKGKRRATVECVARLLRLILSFVENYLIDFPEHKQGYRKRD